MMARMTKQRRVIFDELAKLKSHPTAEELYELVRRKLPRISIGTVYRNLMQMSEEGCVLCLSGGTKRRFDADVSEHAHFRCNQCGRVIDVLLQDVVLVQKIMEQVADYDVKGMRIEYFGNCKDCSDENREIEST